MRSPRAWTRANAPVDADARADDVADGDGRQTGGEQVTSQAGHPDQRHGIVGRQLQGQVAVLDDCIVDDGLFGQSALNGNAIASPDVIDGYLARSRSRLDTEFSTARARSDFGITTLDGEEIIPGAPGDAVAAAVRKNIDASSRTGSIDGLRSSSCDNQDLRRTPAVLIDSGVVMICTDALLSAARAVSICWANVSGSPGAKSIDTG